MCHLVWDIFNGSKFNNPSPYFCFKKMKCFPKIIPQCFLKLAPQGKDVILTKSIHMPFAHCTLDMLPHCEVTILWLAQSCVKLQIPCAVNVNLELIIFQFSHYYSDYNYSHDVCTLQAKLNMSHCEVIILWLLQSCVKL